MVYSKSISVQNYFKDLSRMWLSWRQPLLHKWIFYTNTTTLSNPIALNALAAAAEVLCTTWHWHPLKYTDGFCCLMRVRMELFFPMFTLVLCTENATQFSHRILWPAKQSLIPWKSFSAMLPLDKHMSNKLAFTRFRFTSYIYTVRGFIFLRPLSFEPSVASEYGAFFITSTRESLNKK